MISGCACEKTKMEEKKIIHASCRSTLKKEMGTVVIVPGEGLVLYKYRRVEHHSQCAQIKLDVAF